ncbi:hypothetical protein HNQ91_002306 [Filimonas zeae]|uniref:Uncharacterized protein n=1 Tax=Filimonas zeae TaxID=1737353 RepID=A0A917IUM0_9BACT|nr:hypothetical protein [Filimonas zeae]MDR6339255.1 hypothetical protein [Filimonas zeae]GGH64413.1 hypothetical protein GCM10011379_16440 [Filimonas zeae]
MLVQQQSNQQQEPEIFCMSFRRFRILAVNPGKNTFRLIAMLVGAIMSLTWTFVLVALALRN